MSREQFVKFIVIAIIRIAYLTVLLINIQMCDCYRCLGTCQTSDYGL